jgi:hypothetical protein
MSEVIKGGKGSEESASEMMAILEAELKTVHDVMGKKWRWDAVPLAFVTGIPHEDGSPSSFLMHIIDCHLSVQERKEVLLWSPQHASGREHDVIFST